MDDSYQHLFKWLLNKTAVIDRVSDYGNHWMGIFNDEDNTIHITVEGQETDEDPYEIKKRLEYIRDNKKTLLKWINNTQLNQYFKTYFEERTQFFRIIDELIILIDKLLLNWKVEHYLIEDELHSKIKKNI
jgi:hypothetical protein